MKPFTRLKLKAWLKSLDRRVSSACVALVDPDQGVVVVKASYKDYWSFPGGIIDAGQTPAEAAVREVREEVGLAIAQNTLSFRMVLDRVSDVAQSYQFVFEAPIDHAEIASMIKDGKEIEAIDVVSRNQILERDRPYSQTTYLWANHQTGYHEQQLTIDG